MIIIPWINFLFQILHMDCLCLHSVFCHLNILHWGFAFQLVVEIFRVYLMRTNRYLLNSIFTFRAPISHHCIMYDLPYISPTCWDVHDLYSDVQLSFYCFRDLPPRFTEFGFHIWLGSPTLVWKSHYMIPLFPHSPPEPS